MNSTYKITSMIIISILSIIGYGYFAFAVIPPATTLDPVTDFPSDCTGPTDPDCVISQAWEQDLVNNSVFKTTGNVGIGTDVPDNVLDIIGDVHITNDTVLVDQVTKFGLNLSSAIDSSGVLQSGFIGLNNFVTYTGTGDITAPNFLGTISAGTTALFIDEVASGTLESIGASGIILYNQGAITTPELTGLFVGSINDGVGSSIERILGLNVNTGSSIANPTGIIEGISLGIQSEADIDQVYPITGTAFQYNGTANSVIALQYFSIASLDGVIDRAVAITPRVFTESNGIINNATGIEFSGTTWSDSIDQTEGRAPAVQSVNDARGIYFSGGTIAPFGTISAIESQLGTAYGIQIGTDALDGATGEYGLYIADGENYFSNGVRIGFDAENTKLSNASSGTGSVTLYIGNSTIDVTSPSDERTKQNITETSYGLETLNNIDIVDFTYDQSIISDDNQSHTGVLAQQVVSLYPEAVSTRSDGYMMVDYKSFIPLTMRAIQELDLKLENIQPSITVTSGFSFDLIRDWLGDVGNGIARIVADRLQARNEICIDDVCINKDQLRSLLENNGHTTYQPSGNNENNTDDSTQQETKSENEINEPVDTQESKDSQQQDSSNTIEGSETGLETASEAQPIE